MGNCTSASPLKETKVANKETRNFCSNYKIVLVEEASTAFEEMLEIEEERLEKMYFLRKKVKSVPNLLDISNSNIIRKRKGNSMEEIPLEEEENEE